MKKLIVLSAIALFAVSASAQTAATRNGHGKEVSTHTRETTFKGKEKGESVRDLAKAKRDDDMDNDIKLSQEEKDARKAARNAEKEARKAQRVNEGKDDHFGDLNNDGTISPEEREARKQARRTDSEERRAGRYGEDGINENNEHGKTVSGAARETSLEGREKGAAVSAAASSKARNGERVKATGGAKTRISAKPAGGAARGRSGKIK
ncbi:MAG: hypothetical protein V4721_19180 [Bacteroidota bacterium]